MSTAFHSTFLAGVRTGRGAQDWQTGQEGEAWARQAPGESSSNPRTHDESLDVRMWPQNRCWATAWCMPSSFSIFHQFPL